MVVQVPGGFRTSLRRVPEKRHNSGEAGAGDTLLHAWGILMG